MADRKPEAKPGPDLGPCPGLRPYPGFAHCPDCGGKVLWDPHAPGQLVSPAIGMSHDCATAREQFVQAVRWLAGEGGVLGVEPGGDRGK
jgi:hypothetical protein